VRLPAGWPQEFSAHAAIRRRRQCCAHSGVSTDRLIDNADTYTGFLMDYFLADVSAR
jgi:hypothetical protein